MRTGNVRIGKLHDSKRFFIGCLHRMEPVMLHASSACECQNRLGSRKTSSQVQERSETKIGSRPILPQPRYPRLQAYCFGGELEGEERTRLGGTRCTISRPLRPRLNPPELMIDRSTVGLARQNNAGPKVLVHRQPKLIRMSIEKDECSIVVEMTAKEGAIDC
jgi:hypothetical protein